MEATRPDDKIQAVVALVLQAVDQRLEHVRDQLLQITSTIAHNHADLSRRIDDCQRLAETAVHASTTGAGASAAAATGQLVVAANTLTERVEFLESRVNQYTDERIAELTALIHQVGGVATSVQAPAAVAPVPRPVATASPVAAVAPAVTRLAPLGAVAGPAPVVVATPAPAVAPVAPPAAAAVAAQATAPAPAPAPVEQPIDIALLSAQMSERLAAAVDRALGAMPTSVGAGAPVNSA